MPKLEIRSLILGSTQPGFSPGLESDQIRDYGREHLEKIAETLNQVQTTLLKLPQTVIVDFGEGAQNIAIELGIPADIRLAHINARFKINHSHIGIPIFTSSTLLNQQFGQTRLKNLLYSRGFSAAQALGQGLLTATYDSSNKNEVINQYLHDIQNRSQMAEVQSKFLINKKVIEEIEETYGDDLKIIRGALSVEDWKESKNSPKTLEQDQVKARMPQGKYLKRRVQMTLIPGQGEH
jgi:enoyl-CoA hydratase/carnithine racemase